VVGATTEDDMTERQARADLVLAQRGDREAQARVALFCYNKYLPRLRRLMSKNDDVAMGLEDGEIAFFEGCMRAVVIADGRGDDLYHIGQRGIWAVQSELRAVRKISKTQAGKWAHFRGDGEGDEAADPVARIPDEGALEAYDRVDDMLAARQRIEVLTTAPLKGRLRQAVDFIMSDEADPRETGFNARLAVHMGVSPQRASQVMSELRGLAT
jgi:hypothetical protein